MKLRRKHVRKSSALLEKSQLIRKDPWKILLVDDEEDVHLVTRLALKGFTFAGRKLEFLKAMSALQAKAILNEQPDIAVALVDVVMETDDAGLELAKWIRNNAENHFIRLVIRTGQPGMAPERYVIDNYDIDDYKDKTELTSQKLYTTVRASIKSYRDLMRLEHNRKGLEQIIAAAPEFYLSKSFENFFEGVLNQVVSLCKIGNDAMISCHHCFVATTGESVCAEMQCGVGRFSDVSVERNVHAEFIGKCLNAMKEGRAKLDENVPGIVFPMKYKDEVIGFVYAEGESGINSRDTSLIQVLANQAAAAMANINLVDDLRSSNMQSLEMLAAAAEFNDQDTGNHLNRIISYTSSIALAMGIDSKEATSYGEASMLHDVGKVGIPKSVIRKPGKLTEDEFQIVKGHSKIGAKILSHHRWFAVACQIAQHHHEKWDGSGYPDGLKGEEIPLPARIVAVADVFDALVSRRPYKKPWSLEDAVTEIVKSKGQAFDPQVVDGFLKVHQEGGLQKIMAEFEDSDE